MHSVKSCTVNSPIDPNPKLRILDKWIDCAYRTNRDTGRQVIRGLSTLIYRKPAMKDHPYNKIDDDHYTKDGTYEKRTFIQWLTRKPKNLKVFYGSPQLLIMTHIAIKNMGMAMMKIIPTIYDGPERTITICKPKRYVMGEK